MVGLLTAIHVLVALVLIFIVLLQSAKGTDLASAFGGMGSQAAFGPRGTATFLSKATVALAVIFMLTSFSLAILANRMRGGTGDSVLTQQPPATESQPATPAPGAGAPVTTTTEGPPGIEAEAETVPPSETPKTPETPNQ